MTVSVDLKEADQKRLSELISTWESSSKSDAIRNAIRFCHKKILSSHPSIDGKKKTPVGVNKGGKHES